MSLEKLTKSESTQTTPRKKLKRRFSEKEKERQVQKITTMAFASDHGLTKLD